MVRGSYSPPLQQFSTGSVQGQDSDGNTGLTIGEGELGLRTDGAQQLRATAGGVSMRVPVATVTASDSPYSVGLNDFLILVDSSAGAVQISLPSAVTAAKRRYIIKDKGSASTNSITVTASSGTVDGLGSVSIVNSYAFFTLISDGSNFWVVD